MPTAAMHSHADCGHAAGGWGRRHQWHCIVLEHAAGGRRRIVLRGGVAQLAFAALACVSLVWSQPKRPFRIWLLIMHYKPTCSNVLLSVDNCPKDASHFEAALAWCSMLVGHVEESLQLLVHGHPAGNPSAYPQSCNKLPHRSQSCNKLPHRSTQFITRHRYVCSHRYSCALITRCCGVLVADDIRLVSTCTSAAASATACSFGQALCELLPRCIRCLLQCRSSASASFDTDATSLGHSLLMRCHAVACSLMGMRGSGPLTQAAAMIDPCQSNYHHSPFGAGGVDTAARLAAHWAVVLMPLTQRCQEIQAADTPAAVSCRVSATFIGHVARGLTQALVAHKPHECQTVRTRYMQCKLAVHHSTHFENKCVVLASSILLYVASCTAALVSSLHHLPYYMLRPVQQLLCCSLRSSYPPMSSLCTVARKMSNYPHMCAYKHTP